MDITRDILKQLVLEAMYAEGEKDWDVSKRTAFPRLLVQIQTALREIQDIVDGGHLDPSRPVSDSDMERIKNIFEHPAMASLKKLGNVHVPITHEEAYGLDIDWGGDDLDVDWDYNIDEGLFHDDRIKRASSDPKPAKRKKTKDGWVELTDEEKKAERERAAKKGLTKGD